MDAIAPGDRDPWTRYVDNEVVYSGEDGSTKSKAHLVDEIRSFPKDIWGKLRKIFQRDAKGAVTGFVERRESWDIAWQRLPGAHSD